MFLILFKTFHNSIICLVIFLNSMLFCKTNLSPTLQVALAQVTTTIDNINDINITVSGIGHVVNLTRQHDGDVFFVKDMLQCNTNTCVTISSGTAELFISNGKLKSSPTDFFHENDPSEVDICKCRCYSHLETYREDLGICVNTIHECRISSFINGSVTEKIPSVVLPLQGQIIYPGREIDFADTKTPVCAVTGAQYLTPQGWSDLRNSIDSDYPFRMFRDDGKTYLKWFGEPELLYKMQGRLILVHLLCRDISAIFNDNKDEKNSSLPPDVQITKGIFTPCVAFRVTGSPVKYSNNVSEVIFQSESSSSLLQSTDGLSTKEYIVIGICSLLLGLIYVASVFLYLHVKKHGTCLSNMRNSILNMNGDEINYPKTDQNTAYISPFSRAESLYKSNSYRLSSQKVGTSISIADSNRSRCNSFTGSITTSLKDDIGIFKSNPLLQHYPDLSDNSGFKSDLSNSNSECEDGSHSFTSPNDKIKNIQIPTAIHSANGNGNANENNGDYSNDNNLENSSNATQENECLPEENISIVEDIATNDEKMDNVRSIVNGTVRKKLYFNPAYFEPHLLSSPPPAALEFLTKIREVITIAKYKVAAKRYQPSLQLIPEEGILNGSDIYNQSSKTSQSRFQQSTNYSDVGSRKSSNFSPDYLSCTGCPGCSGSLKTQSRMNNNNNNSNVNNNDKLTSQLHEQSEKNMKKDANHKCNNCGDKRNSIEKWLETIPGVVVQNDQILTKLHQSTDTTKCADNVQNINKHTNSISSDSLNKSLTAPKILGHSLKPQHSLNSNQQQQQQQKSTMNRANAATKTISPNTNFPITKNNVFMLTGSEMYNNPKFKLYDSSTAAVHKTNSNGNTSMKRIEIVDQYTNSQKPKFINQFAATANHNLYSPSPIYETMNKNYPSRSSNTPTPDYDSGGFCQRVKDMYLYSSLQGGPNSDFSVPTPDYSTLGKKSIHQHQPPDSPIYRRKSPQYLIVDYETDSLERNTTSVKRERNQQQIISATTTTNSSSSQSLSNSSTSSSQPSPSLSAALPLEEEVEIHHTVYDGRSRKTNDMPSNCDKDNKIRPRIKYDTPFQGSMTIEVEHEPQLNDVELSTDSDQFEPDTLDRKPRKFSFRDIKHATQNSMPSLLSEPNYIHNSSRKSNGSGLNDILGSFHRDSGPYSLGSMTSLPELNIRTNKTMTTTTTPKTTTPNLLNIRSNSSFRNTNNISNNNKRRLSHNYSSSRNPIVNNNCNVKSTNFMDIAKQENEWKDGGGSGGPPSFGSLREIYQLKNQEHHSLQSLYHVHDRPKLFSLEEFYTNANKHDNNSEMMGRNLTLERRHSKRQRKVPDDEFNYQSIIVPPDIIPENDFKDNTKKFQHKQINNNPMTTTNGQQHSLIQVTNSTNKNHNIFHETKIERKNLIGWNISDFNRYTTTKSDEDTDRTFHHEDTDTMLSACSASTEITGVSDTKANSELEEHYDNEDDNNENDDDDDDELLDKVQQHSAIYDYDNNNNNNSMSRHHNKQQQQQHSNSSLSSTLSRSSYDCEKQSYDITKVTNKDEEYSSYSSTDYSIYHLFTNCSSPFDRVKSINHHDASNNNKKFYEDPDKIEVISTKSLYAPIVVANATVNDDPSQSSHLSKAKSSYYETSKSSSSKNEEIIDNDADSNSSKDFPSFSEQFDTKLTTTIQNVDETEVVSPVNGMQIAINLRDRVKKSKYLKSAWRKFMSLVVTKPNATNVDANIDNGILMNMMNKKSSSLPNEFDSSLPINDAYSSSSVIIVDNDNSITHNLPATKQSNVNNNNNNNTIQCIKESNSFKDNSPSSKKCYEQKANTSSVIINNNNNNNSGVTNQKRDLDSGYISSESNEIYSKKFYTKYNFKQLGLIGGGIGAKKQIIEDNILEQAQSSVTNDEKQHRTYPREIEKTRRRILTAPSSPPPPPPVSAAATSSIPSSYSVLRQKYKLNTNGFVQNDEREEIKSRNSYKSCRSSRSNSTSCRSSESDEEGMNTEDTCESGAESIETNSVLFKSIRNTNETPSKNNIDNDNGNDNNNIRNNSSSSRISDGSSVKENSILNSENEMNHIISCHSDDDSTNTNETYIDKENSNKLRRNKDNCNR